MLINELGATLDFKKSLRNSKLRVIEKNWRSVLWSMTPLFSKICLNVQCYPELAQFDKNGSVKLQIRVNCSKTSDIFVFQIYYNAAIKKMNLKLIKHNGKTQ